MDITKDNFKVVNNGKYVLQALFCEYSNSKYTKYTLKREDYNGFPSLYRLYMECDDPTEYSFATEYLHDWKHWTTLCETNWFAPIIQEWREELEIKHQSLALSRLKTMAENKNDKNTYMANKYLLDKGWKEKKQKTTNTAKQKIQETADKLAQERIDEQADFNRIVN